VPTSIFYPIESRSGSRKTIDIEHAKIHNGLTWVASHSVSVGTGTAVSVMVTTPASGTYHLTYEVEASNTLTYTFSEAPNASGGTTIASANRLRTGGGTDTLTLKHTVTYTSSGTVLERHLNGSTGVPSKSTGGSSGSRAEWILAASTSYLVYATAGNAGTTVNVNLDYYRES
jgi:hypothetical protein